MERTKLMGIASDTLSSNVYYLIALIHYSENRLPEPLEAWKLSEPRNDVVNRARISFALGMILFSANRDTKPWKYMEISLAKNLELLS